MHGQKNIKVGLIYYCLLKLVFYNRCRGLHSVNVPCNVQHGKYETLKLNHKLSTQLYCVI